MLETATFFARMTTSGKSLSDKFLFRPDSRSISFLNTGETREYVFFWYQYAVLGIGHTHNLYLI